jgi:hypothetical protein
MAVDNYFILAMSQGIASVAPPNSSGTDNMAALTNPWTDLGAISTAGLSENPAETRVEFKRWGSIAVFGSVITDQKHTFDVSFLETNPNVLGWYHKQGAALVPSGSGVNEVQTVTISGGPTGGTFSLTFQGQTTPALAYNASTSAVQTALQALSTIGAGNATVTGTAGTSYVVTFVGALAATNVPSIVAVGTFTGGTTPAIAVATTTGGASGQLLTVTDDTTGSKDIRAVCFDLLQGTNHERIYCPQAEITARKPVVRKTDSITEYGVTITAYPNSAGVAVKRSWLLDAVVQGL